MRVIILSYYSETLILVRIFEGFCSNITLIFDYISQVLDKI